MSTRTRRRKIHRSDLDVTSTAATAPCIAAWELDLVTEAIEKLLRPREHADPGKEARDESYP